MMAVFARTLQETYLEQRNWFQRHFMDWHMPWWTGIALYCTLFAGWILCFLFTLVYGVKFTEDQVGFSRGERPWDGWAEE